MTDLTGERFGMLTAVSPTDQRKNGYMVWRCRCDCGNEILVDYRKLRRGTAVDCGCQNTVVGVDLTGRRFGKLVALHQTGETSPAGRMWFCQCDCGGTIEAPRGQLVSGYRRSCGCLGHPPRKEYIGLRFGMLTVIGYEGKRSGMHRWRCRCDCGNETVVGQTLLQSGKTKSCGCLQKQTYAENLQLIDGTSVTVLEASKHLSAANTSGCTGVYLDKKTGTWVARISFKKKRYYLGGFARKEDAIKARARGEEMRDDFLDWYYENYPDKKPKGEQGSQAAEP